MPALRQLSGLSPWARILVIFVILWGLLVVIFISKLNVTNGMVNDASFVEHRLNRGMEYLEESRKRNQELQILIDNLIE